MITQKNNIYSNNNEDCSLEVRIANKPWEKKEIYKLRYQVYVEEMGKPLGAIVNKRKQIFDALDDRSILIYVQSGDTIAATVRVTIDYAENFPVDLAEVFQMKRFELLNPKKKSFYALATKLACRPQYRSSPALYLMLVKLYQLFDDYKVPFCFTGCNPATIPLYERLGFIRFSKNFSDPGYGLLSSLVLEVDDLDYLKSIKSPTHRVARSYYSSSTVTRQIFKIFPDAFKYHNTQLITQENLREYIAHTLNNTVYMYPVFRNLAENENH